MGPPILNVVDINALASKSPSVLESPMKSLETLLKYFPTGTTEGERHILRKAFVQLDEYADIVSPPPFSPRVLIGKKGSGKSAIIDFSMAFGCDWPAASSQLPEVP